MKWEKSESKLWNISKTLVILMWQRNKLICQCTRLNYRINYIQKFENFESRINQNAFQKSWIEFCENICLFSINFHTSAVLEPSWHFRKLNTRKLYNGEIWNLNTHAQGTLRKPIQARKWMWNIVINRGLKVRVVPIILDTLTGCQHQFIT